jgi:hypothetical protein
LANISVVIFRDDVNPEDGNCNVCQDGKPSTFSVAYSRKLKFSSHTILRRNIFKFMIILEPVMLFKTRTRT